MENNVVAIHEDKWNKEPTLSDCGSYVVKYPFSKSQGYPVDVHILKRKIDITETTFVKNDKYNPEQFVSVTEFRSISGWNQVGALVTTTATGASTSALTGATIAATAATYASGLALSVIGGPLVAAGALVLAGIATVGSGVFAGSKMYGRFEDVIKTQPCKGTVTFYGKESDNGRLTQKKGR